MATVIVKTGGGVRAFMHGVRSIFQPLKIRDMRLRLIGNVSDREALASDWTAVGDDIQEAMAVHGARTIK